MQIDFPKGGIRREVDRKSSGVVHLRYQTDVCQRDSDAKAVGRAVGLYHLLERREPFFHPVLIPGRRLETRQSRGLFANNLALEDY